MNRNIPLLFIAFPLLGCGEAAVDDASPVVANGSVEADAKTDNAVPNDNAIRDPTPSTPDLLKVGPVTARFDPALLALVPAGAAVPPDWQNEVQGLKLIARDRVELIGKAECMYGQSGSASTCNAEREAGLTVAVVDRPFKTFQALLTDPPAEPIKLAGKEGLRWGIGAEGEGAVHFLAPLDNKTLLVVRQYRNSTNPDSAAIEKVLAGLAISSKPTAE